MYNFISVPGGGLKASAAGVACSRGEHGRRRCGGGGGIGGRGGVHRQPRALHHWEERAQQRVRVLLAEATMDHTHAEGAARRAAQRAVTPGGGVLRAACF
jgi:hypothetical protein